MAEKTMQNTYRSESARKAAATRARNREAAPPMIYKSTAKSEFGLTDAEIEQMGEPDKLVRNPHYRSGPRARLYRLDRVVAYATSIGK